MDGGAIGGGAEFSLAGDLRLATTSTYLDFRQLRVGLPTGFGGASRLVTLIGKAHATNILFNTQLLQAEKAYHLGLFTNIYKNRESMMEARDQLIDKISGFSPCAVATQKKFIQEFLCSDRI